MVAAAGSIVEIDDVFTTTAVQYFTASGTWTKPAGAQRVRVQCWGGGGAGAGAPATAAGQGSCGGGGQGGGYGETWFDAAGLASSETVTIGAGGAGASGATGGVGGNTTFSSGSNLVQGGGGNGGPILGASASAGVTDQSTLSQTLAGGLTCQGGAGNQGLRNYGGAGSGAGGNGGLAPGMGGNAAGTVNANGQSAPANSAGGGGGAGNNASQSARTGGNGGSGRCIVTTYI